MELICLVWLSALLSSVPVSVSGLKCFSDVRGFQQTHCSAAGGFKTCFTKFDNSGTVTARGCSTKDKLYHVECENHVMGKTVRTTETFCYCSYSFCNSRAGRLDWRGGSSMMIVTACLTITFISRLLSTL